MNTRMRRAVVLVATLLTVAITARLGIWQLDRAAQKEALQAMLDRRATLPPLGMAELARVPSEAPEQHYRRVRLIGQWVGEHTVFLDNRQMRDAPGFFVVTPLRLRGGSDAVLVQRGWVPRNTADRTALPSVPTPTGEVVVDGIAAPPPGRLYQFSDAASGLIRQNLAIPSFSAETGLALRPLTVLQVDTPSMPADGLMRQWARPAIDVQMHYGYAFQWFALSTLAAGLYVWFQLIRARHATSA
jgi:surfeit locus 1 family protein